MLIHPILLDNFSVKRDIIEIGYFYVLVADLKIFMILVEYNFFKKIKMWAGPGICGYACGPNLCGIKGDVGRCRAIFKFTGLEKIYTALAPLHCHPSTSSHVGRK